MLSPDLLLSVSADVKSLPNPIRKEENLLCESSAAFILSLLVLTRRNGTIVFWNFLCLLYYDPRRYAGLHLIARQKKKKSKINRK
jgi:hypothetical protein